MPPGQPPGSLGFLAPTVLPLPSAASGQDSPGGPSASSPMGGAPRTVPPKEPAASAGKEEEGGGGSGGYKSQDTPSWSSAGDGGGCPMQRGLQGCSASWGQSIFVQRLFLLLPLSRATGREKHLRYTTTPP